MEKETFDGNDIEVTETETSEQLLQFTLEQQRISIFIVCRIRRLMEKIFLMRTGQKLRTI